MNKFHQKHERFLPNIAVCMWWFLVQSQLSILNYYYCCRDYHQLLSECTNCGKIHSYHLLKKLLCYLVIQCNKRSGKLLTCWCLQKRNGSTLFIRWLMSITQIYLKNLPHLNKKTYEKRIQMWYIIMHWKSISQIFRIVTRNMKKVVIRHNNGDNDSDDDDDEIWLIDYVYSWDQEMWSDT